MGQSSLREPAIEARQPPTTDRGVESPDEVEQLVAHAAHLLPSQGPITVFVHHNTLHAFEHLPFDTAVLDGAAAYGCHPYLPEEHYRREMARGRIVVDDIAAVLTEDLGDDADVLIGFMGTRYHLRLAMLEHPLRIGPDAELRWLIAETDALYRFRPEAPADLRGRVVDQVKQWMLRDYIGRARSEGHRTDGIDELLSQFGTSRIERWSRRTWESFTLHLLWRICRSGVHAVEDFSEQSQVPVRHSELLLLATGRDADLLVNEVLIRFCAAFLDQGLAGWSLPGRHQGFFRAFLDLYRDARPVDPWLAGLPSEVRRLEAEGITPSKSIVESLQLLGVSAPDRFTFIERTLLALPGWAGILRQMETNAEWAAHPAPCGTLHEYLAVRLILERLALSHIASEELSPASSLTELRRVLRHRLENVPGVSVEKRAYLIFQLAQVRGWNPFDLYRLTKVEWSRLVREIESFGSFDRRRIYHGAYERHYRNQALGALAARARVSSGTGAADACAPPGDDHNETLFQVVCCIDEREESFRRHLEEVEPRCETFGIAGFFGAAMYYRGVAEAHFRPLCPINIKPRHYVQEEPIRSFEDAGRIQAEARRWLGKLLHGLHTGTRTFTGGLLTGMLGSLATVPLLMRVLWPRGTARLRRMLGRIVTPPVTQLRLERTRPEPGPEPGHLGYTVTEMAGVVGGALKAMGLTRGFAPLVVVTGHGSSSLNNPHGAAYDCGACGGARGGPNARAFAQMANDLRVRRHLLNAGVAIPDDVYFIGAYHNTCDDGLTYFDLDRLPTTRGETFDRVRATLEEARKRNAHERCRRFASAPLILSADEALRHVEGRAEDLSQTRPECGHATNALCIVGRRSRTRGLFLDRRAFLTSYDPTQDDADSSTLRALLRAVIPVCAGINLEYYFSAVDPAGYGCGTKLPHNITALLGVMDGASSDLRPGLPWQMVEIHEPMRILLVVESRPEAVASVIAGDEIINRLVRNSWMQLATLDPGSARMHIFRRGRFEPYEAEAGNPAVALSSLAWYRGWRDHLEFAFIGTKSDHVINDRGAPA